MRDFDEVEEVILFGSLARSDEGTDSDADVLIILSNSTHVRYFDRIPEYAVLFAQFDIPVDVFPYTRAELNRMQNKGNTFIQAMLDEGISLSKRLKQV